MTRAIGPTSGLSEATRAGVLNWREQANALIDRQMGEIGHHNRACDYLQTSGWNAAL